MKLTTAQRDALQWFYDRDPIAWFDRHAPSQVVRNRLHAAGLIGCVYPPSRVGPLCWSITDLGRAALTQDKP